MYFQTDRDDFKGDIYVSQRASTQVDFTTAVPVTSVVGRDLAFRAR